ncbi:hypothetical protein U1Q18_051660, partial [Sarracenia purpurea var. burkii]
GGRKKILSSRIPLFPLFRPSMNSYRIDLDSGSGEVGVERRKLTKRRKPLEHRGTKVISILELRFRPLRFADSLAHSAVVSHNWFNKLRVGLVTAAKTVWII